MLTDKSHSPASLSDREMEILELVATGLTNLEISQKLEISKRTVDNHISNILTKTKTENQQFQIQNVVKDTKGSMYLLARVLL
jgi:DNA-binding CsgD family transcriptional regulator